MKMTKKVYKKAYFTNLIPKKLRREEKLLICGISQDDMVFNSKSDLIDELGLAMSTLTAIFDQEHQDHSFYDALDIQLNHVELWNKIEDDLHALIGSIMEFNREDYSDEEDN